MKKEQITKKAILVFDLNDIDSRLDFHNITHVDDFLYSLNEVRSICRQILKYGTEKSIEQICNQINETVHESLSKIED